MTADDGHQPTGGKRRTVTMRDLAASYRPRRMRDLLFLHGLARIAARQALRTGDPLYVPREWQPADPADGRD